MKRLTILLLSGLAVSLGACQDREARELGEEEVGEQPAPETGEASDSLELLNDATEELREMKEDADLRQLVQNAKGVFLVPEYARAAVGIGARGGEGVLLAQHSGNQWSGPVFYDIGAISVGAQFGAEGGGVAILLMTDEAMKTFGEDDTTINADAGLTVVDYSARAEATLGKEDVILWSNAEGAFAGVSLGVKDVDFDEEENAAFYGKQVTSQELLGGKMTTPPGAAALKKELTSS